MLKKNTKYWNQIPVQPALVFLSICLFVPFLGNVHLFDWDEINFAESAREMLLTGNWRMVQINFQPFYEKPPLFIWLQAISMKYFGVNEMAARLPNAIVGILSILSVYQIGKKYFNHHFGLLWSAFLACSFLPFAYFKSGIIDPVFNYFIFLSLYSLFKISIKDEFESNKLRAKNHRYFILLSALFAGLAVLTKGPVAVLVLVCVVTVVLIINKGKLNFSILDFILWLLILLVVIGAWLSFEVRQNGWRFIDEFISYQIKLFSTEDAGHGGPFYFHFIVLLIGCFPASVFVFNSLKPSTADTFHQLSFKRWMIVLLCVVLVIFSIVKTKIVHYSSLCYFPITFLAAYYFDKVFQGFIKFKMQHFILYFLLAIIISISAILAPIVIQHKEMLMPYIHDGFAIEAIKTNVIWSNKDSLFGLFLLITTFMILILIFKKQLLASVITILISCNVFIYGLLYSFVPRVEMYSQNALIEFLQTKKLENCFVIVEGFKSYASLFYLEKKWNPETNDYNTEKMIEQNEQTVYVITKTDKLDKIIYKDKLEELYRKSGYVFLRKK